MDKNRQQSAVLQCSTATGISGAVFSGKIWTFSFKGESTLKVSLTVSFPYLLLLPKNTIMSRTDGGTGQLIGVRCFSLCNTQGCLLRTNKILNEILSKCHNINILSKQYRGGPQHPRPRFKKIELELRCISVEWEIGPEMPSCWPTVNRRVLLRSERGPGRPR